MKNRKIVRSFWILFLFFLMTGCPGSSETPAQQQGGDGGGGGGEQPSAAKTTTTITDGLNHQVTIPENCLMKNLAGSYEKNNEASPTDKISYDIDGQGILFAINDQTCDYTGVDPKQENPYRFCDFAITCGTIKATVYVNEKNWQMSELLYGDIWTLGGFTGVAPPEPAPTPGGGGGGGTTETKTATCPSSCDCGCYSGTTNCKTERKRCVRWDMNRNCMSEEEFCD